MRLVADAVRGATVAHARIQLDALVKRGAPILKKLLQSVVANATQSGMQADRLRIQKLTVDEGRVLKRTMPRAHGRGALVRKRTSHVTIVVSEDSTHTS